MMSLNTYEGNLNKNIQYLNLVKLKEETHGLKLENDLLKIQAIEREKND